MSIGNELLNKFLERINEIADEGKLEYKISDDIEAEADLVAGALQDAGYFAEVKTINKNGVDISGIMMGYTEKDEVKPFFYLDGMEGDAEDKARELMKEFRNLDDVPSIDIKDEEDFLSHLYIGVQNSNIKDKLYKHESNFPEIDYYVYYRKGNYSFKITEELAENYKDYDLFEIAKAHSFSETKVESLYDTLVGLIGSEFAGMPKAPVDDIYVLTNKEFYRGASAMLDEDFMVQFCEEHGWEEVIFLPSSIHEVLMMPYDESYNLDRLKKMVEDINLNEVKPEERLTDRVYVRRYL